MQASHAASGILSPSPSCCSGRVRFGRRLLKPLPASVSSSEKWEMIHSCPSSRPGCEQVPDKRGHCSTHEDGLEPWTGGPSWGKAGAEISREGPGGGRQLHQTLCWGQAQRAGRARGRLLLSVESGDATGIPSLRERRPHFRSHRCQGLSLEDSNVGPETGGGGLGRRLRGLNSRRRLQISLRSHVVCTTENEPSVATSPVLMSNSSF